MQYATCRGAGVRARVIPARVTRARVIRACVIRPPASSGPASSGTARHCQWRDPVRRSRHTAPINMNLFLLARALRDNSERHADTHIDKMPHEATQILMTAWHCAGAPFVWATEPYKPTHHNHPMCVWVRRAPRNYEWAVGYGRSRRRCAF